MPYLGHKGETYRDNAVVDLEIHSDARGFGEIAILRRQRNCMHLYSIPSLIVMGFFFMASIWAWSWRFMTRLLLAGMEGDTSSRE